tara:strand:- start:616 stop:1125 length:510 start_codon:yes stop_codon:yes gene_type:complete
MNTWREAVGISDTISKSYHKLQGRYFFSGLPISIENKRGSIRRGTDPDGNKWKTHMKNDYGYIRSTLGVDGDEVDCFIGPDKVARNAYVIRANTPNSSGSTWKYDEDKIMLGFSTKEKARKAFLSHYNKKEFLGRIDTYSMEAFRSKVFDKKNRGKMVKSFVSISERII